MHTRARVEASLFSVVGGVGVVVVVGFARVRLGVPFLLFVLIVREKRVVEIEFRVLFVEFSRNRRKFSLSITESHIAILKCGKTRSSPVD